MVPKTPRLHTPTCSGREQELTEVIRHQTATSEMLRVIASSPHDLQPIFDRILDSGMRLCRAEFGSLRLREKEGYHLMALKGHPKILERWSRPELLEHDSCLAQFAASGSPVHVPDFAAHELYHRGDAYMLALVNLAGFRTGLVVPLVKDDEVIGIISLGRRRVQPFTDKQIELIADFAAQAVIALEITRRERQYREAQMELAHANRVTTMGQLTASIAHEITQPVAATATNADTALCWLDAQPPDLEEVRQALGRIVRDSKRASDVIGRIRALIKKAPPRKDRLEINGAIRDVIELTRGEAVKNGVSVEMQLAEGLPLIRGDRVQVQQVMLNLIVNAIQAMSGLAEGKRELDISTEIIESEGVRVAVRDSGPGLSAESLQRLFEPFYTTKRHGLGMGLSICRSIIEDHGGRLWVSVREPQGALFQFTIPAS